MKWILLNEKDSKKAVIYYRKLKDKLTPRKIN